MLGGVTVQNASVLRDTLNDISYEFRMNVTRWILHVVLTKCKVDPGVGTVRSVTRDDTQG